MRPNILGRINHPRRRGEKPMMKSNFRAARVGTAGPDAVLTFDRGSAGSLIDDYPPRPAYVYGRQNGCSSFTTAREQFWSILEECIALEQENVRPWPIFSLWCV